MLATVFAKTLRDQRRSLLGWSLGIAILVGLMSALWPSVRDMPDVEEFLASYPEALRELFNLSEFLSGAGYLNAELFSWLLPVLFIVFGIGRGARLVAGEEEAGTLEVLLVTPVSAVRLVLEKAAALAVSLLVLGLVLLASTLAASVLLDMGVGVADLAGGALAMVLLGLEYGCLALAVGAATGRRAWAIGVAAGAATLAYVLYVAGTFVSAVEPWQPLSPFHQALEGGPLGAGLQPAYGWMALGAVVVLVAALPVFDRRDVAAR